MKKRFIITALALAIVSTGCSAKDLGITNNEIGEEQEAQTEAEENVDAGEVETDAEENDDAEPETAEDLSESEDKDAASATDVDLSEFAGTYKATDWSNEAYGGGESLEDVELKATGAINCSIFPSSAPPIEITKNTDGSYHVMIINEDELTQFFYDLYPAGVLGEDDAGTPELKDSVYIRVTEIDGGVMIPVYVKQ